jgi:hypothetical protein
MFRRCYVRAPAADMRCGAQSPGHDAPDVARGSKAMTPRKRLHEAAAMRCGCRFSAPSIADANVISGSAALADWDQPWLTGAGSRPGLGSADCRPDCRPIPGRRAPGSGPGSGQIPGRRAPGSGPGSGQIPGRRAPGSGPGSGQIPRRRAPGSGPDSGQIPGRIPVRFRAGWHRFRARFRSDSGPGCRRIPAGAAAGFPAGPTGLDRVAAGRRPGRRSRRRDTLYISGAAACPQSVRGGQE